MTPEIEKRIEALRAFRIREEAAKRSQELYRAGKRDEYGNPIGAKKKKVVAAAVRKRHVPDREVVARVAKAKKVAVERAARAATCEVCDKPFREHGTTVKMFPGTVLARRGNECENCARRREYAAQTGAERRRRMEPSDECRLCGRGLRPWGTDKADHPGLLARGSGTTCTTCQRKPGSPRRRIRATHCLGCERPMRKSGQPKAEFPEAVTYGSMDMCRTCIQAKKRA